MYFWIMKGQSHDKLLYYHLLSIWDLTKSHYSKSQPNKPSHLLEFLMELPPIPFSPIHHHNYQKLNKFEYIFCIWSIYYLWHGLPLVIRSLFILINFNIKTNIAYLLGFYVVAIIQLSPSIFRGPFVKKACRHTQS